MNIIRRHVQTVTRAMEQPVPELPLYKVDETNTPEKIATLVRKKWNISAGAVENLRKLLGERGLIISHFDFGTKRGEKPAGRQAAVFSGF